MSSNWSQGITFWMCFNEDSTYIVFLGTNRTNMMLLFFLLNMKPYIYREQEYVNSYIEHFRMHINVLFHCINAKLHQYYQCVKKNYCEKFQDFFFQNKLLPTCRIILRWIFTNIIPRLFTNIVQLVRTSTNMIPLLNLYNYNPQRIFFRLIQITIILL